ncbi:Thioredoxin-like domain-containing protein [Cladophialophora immunda]|nr:Thioredoxin-like domain-containing protein [Cladophialophora immunda]
MHFFARILLAGLAAAVQAQWQHVSDAEFHSLVDSNDLLLAAFVAPWTGPCKSLASEWAATKSQLTYPAVSIDCTANQTLCSAHNVHSYPAIRLFRGPHEWVRYRGPRKASAIVPFVRRASLPVVSEVNIKNITALTGIDRVTFVAYLKEDDHSMRSRFTKVAETFRDQFVFGISNDKRLAEKENIAFPSIIAYRTDVGDQEVLQGTVTRSVIGKFILEAGKPLIDELTRRNEIDYMSSHKLLAYIFVADDADRTLFRRKLHPVAKQYKDYVNFVTIDGDEYGHMAASLGLHRGHYPSFTVYSAWKDQVFPYPAVKRIEADNIEAFLLEILHGERAPWSPSGTVQGQHDEL